MKKKRENFQEKSIHVNGIDDAQRVKNPGKITIRISKIISSLAHSV